MRIFLGEIVDVQGTLPMVSLLDESIDVLIARCLPEGWRTQDLMVQLMHTQIYSKLFLETPYGFHKE